MKTVELTREQQRDLTILLNITLRERSLRPEYYLRLNDIMQQMTGSNHERHGEMQRRLAEDEE